MRIANANRGERGSVLAIALVSALLIGIGLASYLMLVRDQNISTVRSQAWNAALAMAEAGVEEALAQLNPSALLFVTNANRGANGWETRADGYYCLGRNLTNGYYDVKISTDPLPLIWATGYVRVPTFSEPIRRVVQVKTTYGRLFSNAMAARINIDFKGFGVETDSFDSEDPLKSTNGLYDRNKRSANGDVATQSGLLNVGNAKMMGKLQTGPGATYALGPNGSVGSVSWVEGGTLGIQDGYYVNDFNMDFPEIAEPYKTGLGPESATIDGTNYTYVLGSFNYIQAGNVRLQSGDKVLVTGRSRLYVTGDFEMLGGAELTIAPGATLELYVAGANTSLTKINNAGTCNDFRYYGLPGNVNLALSGNDLFLGSIYAPNADFYLGGGGANDVDFQGACVVNTIRMNGHFKFHFDENLRRKGPVKGFQVTHWAEL